MVSDVVKIFLLLWIVVVADGDCDDTIAADLVGAILVIGDTNASTEW